MEVRYALLAPSGTPEPCSREAWLEWRKSPQCDPCLARERLGLYGVELHFTGSWEGPAGEPPCFFTVCVTDPYPTYDEWHFETCDQARQALKGILEEVRERAEAQEEEYPGFEDWTGS